MWPWHQALGAREGLAASGRPAGAEDDPAALRSALEATLEALEPQQRVETAFRWLLGHRPDAGALRYHADEIARRPDGTSWLLDCLAAAGDAGGAVGDASREAAAASAVLAESRALPDAEFVQRAYQRVLGRPADEAGRAHYVSRLARGETNRPHVLRDLFASAELATAPAEPREEERTDAASMAAAWDARARQDARFFIASGASTGDQEFRISGERELQEVILNGLELGRAADVLEIGCGIGRMLAPLSHLVRTAHGVDISAAMIERARAYCAGLANVRLSVTGGTLPELPDASVDFVFSYLVFQHVPERAAIETYVREAARVLRPGGVLRFQVDGRAHLARKLDLYDGVKLSGPAVRRIVSAADLDLRDEWGEDTHYFWVDATKGPGSAGSSVRLLPRSLDTTFLRFLLADGGSREPGALVREVAARSRSLRSALSECLETLPSEPQAFVRALYRFLLDRDPREDEVLFQVGALERGWADRDDILDSLVTCGPFRDRVYPVAGTAHERRVETA